MSTRYGDRDNDRGQQEYGRQNYGRRQESEYGRSYNDRSQQGRYGSGRDENERYSGESRWRGQYGGSMSSRSGREHESGRQDYGRDWDDRDYEGNREYGSSSPLGLDAQRRFREASSNYSRRYDYPSDYPTRDMYGNAGNRPFDYDRSRYGRGAERGYEYERDQYGSGEDRGWWDRASDAVASWFGDEEAERRRRMDSQRDEYRGRGPKGYRRSDERIKEDVNDRLSEGYLDASEVEVTVQSAEVTLTGTVNSRRDKRRAEDIAESVTGVTNVENRLRVKQTGGEGYSTTPTGYGSTGTTDTSATSTTAGQSTGAARSRTAGSS
jgi:osmotically-inducible protein OsmY